MPHGRYVTLWCISAKLLLGSYKSRKMGKLPHFSTHHLKLAHHAVIFMFE